MEGEGFLKYNNSESYFGAFSENVAHGYGVHTFSTGAKYEGTFNNG